MSLLFYILIFFILLVMGIGFKESFKKERGVHNMNDIDEYTRRKMLNELNKQELVNKCIQWEKRYEYLSQVETFD